jgi:hypothetical protein
MIQHEVSVRRYPRESVRATSILLHHGIPFTPFVFVRDFSPFHLPFVLPISFVLCYPGMCVRLLF